LSDASHPEACLIPNEGDTSRTLGWKMMLEAAKIARQQDDVDDAKRLYKLALELAEKRLGPDHVVIAYSLMEMAEFYFSMEDYGSAHSLHTRAKEILGRHIEEAHAAFQ
jgi:tetratricopeptide (TPR) repeat protein